ncbi:hypothetical protein [Streptomyces sp. NPDC005732]|uniref:hypothetical protein n=1 Tax=Streptomyces sp. NPDC005732 TaxID=3157057 RepID=UPI0033C92BBF
MPEQQPSVGRIVHYVSHGSPVLPDGSQTYPSQCRAAIVTATDLNPDDTPEPGQVFVGLAVLNPEGMFFNSCVLQDEQDHHGGSWHWPERV